jgi:hypothetical protein
MKRATKVDEVCEGMCGRVSMGMDSSIAVEYVG